MENPIKMDDLGVPLFSETPKYHLSHHLLWHLGFPCWECDEELASQKPKSYHSWFRGCKFHVIKLKCPKNAKPIWDLKGLKSIKRNSWGASFDSLKTKLMSPIPQLQNLKLPILHPKSQEKDSLPVSAAPTTSFRWRSARQQASRLAVIQATKWWTTSQDQVDAAPLIFGTSGRSLFSLTHCKPMRKSISKIYVLTSGIFVWPLANTAAKSQNCLPLMVSKKAVLVAGTCDWHSCYQICAENTAQSPQWIWHLMHVSLSCSKLWVLGCL